MCQAESNPKRRLLIVDDEPDLLTILTILLKEHGEVMGAQSFAEAKRLMQTSSRLDLVITDFNLPDGDGMDVAKDSRRFFPKVPIVLMTASAGAESRMNEMMAMPGVQLLEKPFVPDGLYNAVMSATGTEAAGLN